MNLSVNCLMLGGPGSGKTSLLISYDRGVFLNTTMPTELDIERTITRRNNTFKLKISDLGPVNRSLDETPKLIPSVDAIVLCFDVSKRSSLQTALNIWNYVNTEHSCKCKSRCGCQKPPKLVVVGTKSDLRDNQDVLFELFETEQNVICKKEGEFFAKRLKADLYWETSALCHEGVDELFDEICNLFYPTAFTRMVKNPCCTLFSRAIKMSRATGVVSCFVCARSHTEFS